MPVWPVTLPPPLRDGYALEYLDQVIRSPVEQGPPKTRRRSTWAGPRVTARWLLPDADAEMLREWWVSELQGGALPFVWYEPSRGRPGRWILEGPPRWRVPAYGWTELEASLLALEEWWPGVLAGPGRTIHVWDPRWGPSLFADMAGTQRAAAGGPVGRWLDRVAGAALVAPEDSRRPTLIADATGAHLYTDGNDRLDLAGFQLDLAAFGLAISVTLEIDSGNYRRVLSFIPATGKDWDQPTGAMLNANDHTHLVMWSAAGLSLVADPTYQIVRKAVVVTSTGTATEMRFDDWITSTQTGQSISGLTAGGMIVAAGMEDGSFVAYGKRRYYGLVVITGYTPTPAERTMLSRWAAALAGRDIQS